MDSWEDMRREHLRIAKRQLVDYMQMKIRDEDWHGVADAAMDLREIEAELRGMERA